MPDGGLHLAALIPRIAQRKADAIVVARVITCVGELNLDVLLRLPVDDHPSNINHRAESRVGGTGGTTALMLAKLGAPVRLVASFGGDRSAEMLRAELRAAGVGLENCAAVADRPTLMAIAVIDSAGEKHVWLYPESGSASYELVPSAVRRISWRQGDVLHVSGAALQRAPFREAALSMMEQARFHSTIVSFDVNLRPTTFGSDAEYIPAVERAVAMADYVLGSAAEEINLLAGVSDPVQAARELSGGRRAVVSRLGGGGCLAVDGAGVHRSAAYRTHVRDLLGAGDSFNAGFLTALARDAPLADCMRWGNAVAAAHIGGGSQSDSIASTALALVRRDDGTHAERSTTAQPEGRASTCERSSE